MRSRRSAGLWLVLLLALGACASEVPSNDLVLWHTYRGQEQVTFDAVIADYNRAHPEAPIRAQAIPYDPFIDKVTISVPRGQGPDLFVGPHNTIGTWVEKGVLEPLTGRVTTAELDVYLPESVRALVYRKNLYGLPLTFKTLVMFYNKALLPEPPATMEALVPKLAALQADPGRGKRFGLVYQAGGLYFHAMWVHAFGGTLFDAAHRPAFDTPAQRAALDFVRGLHQDAGVLPSGVNGFMVTSLFNEGNAAVVFNGPWFAAEIGKGVDYGMAPIPTVQGRHPAPFLGVEAVFIAKHSQRKAAALDAARYLAGAASAKRRMDEAGQTVCHAATLAEGATRSAALRVYMQQAEHSVLMDASPEMQLLWGPADIAIAAGIFVRDADLSAELARAQTKMLEALSNAEAPR